jgi:uncharacterized membrane protein
MKQAWVVVLLLILPAVYAANSIETSETTITIEDSIALFETTLTLSPQEEIGNITLIIAPQAEDIQIKIDNQTKTCLIQAEFARCGNLTAGKHQIEIKYETTYPIAKVGENTLFRYTDRLPYPAESQQITLKLPVGYIIPREKGKDESFYISPTPKDVYSDGQRIILNWEHPGQELPISVLAKQVIGPPLGWMASTLLSTLIAATIAIWFVLRHKKEPKAKIAKKKEPAIVPTLIDNEQRVVNFLKENGEVWQKQIQQATGFSKAKVSRVIRNLEARGVITKTPYGNTNKIALKQ